MDHAIITINLTLLLLASRMLQLSRKISEFSEYLHVFSGLAKGISFIIKLECPYKRNKIFPYNEGFNLLDLEGTSITFHFSLALIRLLILSRYAWVKGLN